MIRLTKTQLMVLVASAGWLQAADPDLSKLPPAANQKGVTYVKDIQPLFEVSCFRCHGEQQAKGDLRLDSLEAVLKGSEHGKVVVPGKSTESPLLIAVSHLDEEKAMPPKMRPGRGGPPGGPGNRPSDGQGGAGGSNPPAGNTPPPPGGGGRPPGGFGPPPKPLTAQEVGLVRAWIEQGAK